MKKLVILSWVLAISGITAAAYANYQVTQLNTMVAELRSQNQFNTMLEKNAPEFNDHIQKRISVFIENERKKVAQAKFNKYKNASASLSNEGKRIYGSEKARYTLVEFSDTECPYCKKFHDTPKQLVDASNGLVNWEWKHMPLGFHNPSALQASVAAECANDVGGNQAFWTFLQSVFDTTKGNGQGAGNLMNLAMDLNLNTEAFAICLKDPKHLEKVQADLQHAESIGVKSTPVTYIVDNKTGRQLKMKGMVKPVALVSAIQKLKKEADDVSSTESVKQDKKG